MQSGKYNHQVIDSVVYVSNREGEDFSCSYREWETTKQKSTAKKTTKEQAETNLSSPPSFVSVNSSTSEVIAVHS